MKITEEQIWEYLDGGLSAEDKLELEQAIAGDSEAKALLKQVTELQQLLQHDTLMQPSVLFTESVISAINFEPVAKPFAALSFKPVLVFILPSLLLLAGMVLYLVYGDVQIQNDWVLPSFNVASIKLYLVIADILLAVYFVDEWSGVRRATVSN